MSRHKGSPRLKIAITIAAIWISSALIAISDGVHFTLVKTPDISFCNEVPFTIYGRKYLRYRSVFGYSVLPNTIAKNGAENINKSKSPIDKLTIKALGTVLNDFSLNIIVIDIYIHLLTLKLPKSF
jgi:hypothetical protein